MANNSRLNEVRATLLRVADHLSSLSNSSFTPNPSNLSSTPNASSSSSTPNASGTSGIPTGTTTPFNGNRPSTLSANSSTPTCSSSAVTEHRRLFSFGRRQQYSTSSKSKSKKKGKQPSCTLKFVCLSSISALSPPTSVKEKAELYNAGLGDSSIVMELNDDTAYCHEKLINRYSKLNETGGYELMLFQRGGGSGSGFHVIKSPYTSNRLKGMCAQAKIYIRPLQKNIGTGDEDKQNLEQGMTMVEDDGPIVECFTCGMSLHMSKMKEHQDMHKTDPPELKIQRLDQENTSNSAERDADTESVLKEMCPDVTDSQIQLALSESSGNADEAAQRLLGIPVILINEDGDDHPLSQFIDETGISSISSPAAALLEFQRLTIDEEQPKQRFSVCRVDGISELRKDIMGIYKKPDLKLTANPRVRFEEEEAVGSGPIREFLVNAIRAIDEGIPSLSGRSKPVTFFEGDADHRIPIYDQSLRLTGSFRAVGRIIGHSILHGGPGLHGVSPAVKYFLTSSREFEEPIPIVLEDVPDVDLRQLIKQVDSLEKDENLNPDIKSEIEPYLFEAGLDPDNLSTDRNLVTQGLLMFNVIDKRRLELLDIAKGMDEVSLCRFLMRCPMLTALVFPDDKERTIRASAVLQSIAFEDKDENEANLKTANFFQAYIKEIEEQEEDGAQLLDLLTFWTGGNRIADGENLLVKFDNGVNNLPLSETCFKSIILPTRHATYHIFKHSMDIALKFGSRGFSFS